LVFMIIRLVPGDPARLMLGEKAPNEAVEALRQKLGLNDSLFVQYVRFIQGIIRLDFGNSLKYSRPAVELIQNRLPVTLMLTLMSTAISILISFPMGYMAGMRKDGFFDKVVRTGTLATIAMPTFWIGLLLMILFGIQLKLLPVGGFGEGFGGHVKALILPAFTQSLMTSALIIRNVRNSVVDIMSLDYVDFARSKGISERAVKNRHILKNAMISTVTLLSMRMAYMLGGSVIIETVFALPGIGKLTLDAIFARDYTVVQANVLIFALVVMVINLLTDVLYSFLDPRIKY
ncbi:MAG TPA: ABC transporter permease, partial [Negativicutes bacterium]|nr:ABC transporter permease [Negativicutes bacterium]